VIDPFDIVPLPTRSQQDPAKPSPGPLPRGRRDSPRSGGQVTPPQEAHASPAAIGAAPDHPWPAHAHPAGRGHPRAGPRSHAPSAESVPPSREVPSRGRGRCRAPCARSSTDGGDRPGPVGAMETGCGRTAGW